ncbi:hypothetical protein ACHAQA_000900 [Verticillium albo-atrum]
MPYNRAKGRTSEIPPTPSPGPSRLEPGDDTRSRAGSLSRLISPREIDARLESQLASERRNDSRPWVRWPVTAANLLFVRPVGFLLELLWCIADCTPAVVPAVIAMVFLYIALPLLIARDIL